MAIWRKKHVHSEVIEFLVEIIEHIISVFEHGPVQSENDYEQYDEEEIYGQFYPCFPLKYFRARYGIDSKKVTDPWKDHCSNQS